MIDHISIAVGDLAGSAAFYERLLATIGMTKLVEREGTVGFGKKYPEFWLQRPPWQTARTGRHGHPYLPAGAQRGHG